MPSLKVLNAAAILSEDAARELRLVAEVGHPASHARLMVLHTSGGGPLDDHTVEYGQCHRCGAWIARMTWATNRDVSDRYLSPIETEALQRLDDRYRRADQ